MKIHENISLKPYNTFGIDLKAPLLIEAESEVDILEALKLYPNLKVLGGGSNILLTQAPEMSLLHITQKGISVVHEIDEFVWVRAAAGELWSDFVDYCVAQGYGGVENLALIYGTVGAAPVQNIGAYGVELKDVFKSCEAIYRESRSKINLEKGGCAFGYRDSIFKQRKDTYIITSVTFCLTKQNHQFKTHYGDIRARLAAHGWEESPEHIAQVVKEIRRSKLPNPVELGNSGSFFKNPVIPQAQFLELQKRYPDMPHYSAGDDQEKIPAAYLIESCELKGYRIGAVGVHKGQPLVLVNYGGATGTELLALARYVQEQVKKCFGILMEMEVNVW